MGEPSRKSNNYGLAFVGGVSAMTGIALQVKPEDAVSNLSLWLEFFGVDRVPRFLANTQADTWGTAIGLALAALSFYIWWKRQNAPIKSASGILLQGHGLDHVKVSAVTTDAEARFFPDRGQSQPDYKTHPDYIAEQARQKAIDDAERRRLFRDRSTALGGNLGRAFDRHIQNTKIQDEQNLLTSLQLDRDKKLALQKRRREMIAECRDLAHQFTVGTTDKSFRVFLEEQRVYADIRSHLSANYLKKLNAPRTLYAKAGGAKYDTLVQWFLDDIDRLEKDWDLI